MNETNHTNFSTKQKNIPIRKAFSRLSNKKKDSFQASGQ
jgi:hypothetical protein